MDAAIGGLAQGLNTAIQQYMGMSIQQQADDYKSVRDSAAKRAQSDYEFGHQKELLGLQGEQAMKKSMFDMKLDVAKNTHFKQLDDAIKRKQSVPASALADDPELSWLASVAPDSLLDAKDLLGFYKERQKASSEARPKEFQYKASNYLKLASQAENVLTDLEKETDLAGWNPVDRSDYTPEILRADEWKQFMGARKAIAEAYLRPATGATINKDEYANIDKIFIPQPGDSKEILEQKRSARVNLRNNLKAESEGKTIDNSLAEIKQPGSAPTASTGGWSIKRL